MAFTKKSEIDNWITFAQNYLKMAKLGCLQMLNNTFKDKLDVDYSHFSKRDLFIPTLYNVRHGIEVFIKTLKFTLAEKLSKDEYRHNIHFLFDRLVEEIKKHKIEEVIENKLKSDPNNTNLNIAKEDLKKLPKLKSEINKLVVKYYYCDFITTKIGAAFRLEDGENTLFRYPEDDYQIKINYNKVISKIDEKDVKEILEDVARLQDGFNTMGFIFYAYKEFSEN